MKKFFRNLISIDNSINEPVIVGFILLIPYLFGLFFDKLIPIEKFQILSNTMLICLGVGTTRAAVVAGLQAKTESSHDDVM